MLRGRGWRLGMWSRVRKAYRAKRWCGLEEEGNGLARCANHRSSIAAARKQGFITIITFLPTGVVGWKKVKSKSPRQKGGAGKKLVANGEGRRFPSSCPKLPAGGDEKRVNPLIFLAPGGTEVYKGKKGSVMLGSTIVGGPKEPQASRPRRGERRGRPGSFLFPLPVHLARPPLFFLPRTLDQKLTRD